MAIVTLPKVLKTYHSDLGASLKTYASLAFSNAIRDALRQQREVDSRTDWGLLRKLSQKQLMESLREAGLSEAAIAPYCLVWNCFKTFYAPNKASTTRQLQQPDPKALSDIAALYNRLRCLTPATTTKSPADFSQEKFPEATSEQVECWLKQAASKVRNYLHPRLASLNQSKAEPGSGEILEDIPDVSQDSPMNLLIIQDEIKERNTQRSQIEQCLILALEQLDESLKTILDCYYRQELTQQQIAAQLQTKQYTVSRRLSTAKEKLLLALVQWSQIHLHITLTSSAVKEISLVLEEWLHQHYQREAVNSSGGNP